MDIKEFYRTINEKIVELHPIQNIGKLSITLALAATAMSGCNTPKLNTGQWEYDLKTNQAYKVRFDPDAPMVNLRWDLGTKKQRDYNTKKIENKLTEFNQYSSKQKTDLLQQ